VGREKTETRADSLKAPPPKGIDRVGAFISSEGEGLFPFTSNSMNSSVGEKKRLEPGNFAWPPDSGGRADLLTTQEMGKRVNS